ncbi:hypothetical protein L210DRAFT_3567468, partial [Boletus edulis BED1]
GIPTSKLTFVRGSDYQLSREYNLDNYKLCTLATEHDAKMAGSEVVKQRKIFAYAELCFQTMFSSVTPAVLV